MKNETIAKALKESRKQNALSVKEVAAKLHDKSLDFSEKTIYGRENGQSQPNADTLLILCEIYNIHNILGTFGYIEKQPLEIQYHHRNTKKSPPQMKQTDSITALPTS